MSVIGPQPYGIEAARMFVEKLVTSTNFDKTALAGLQVTSVSKGRMVCTFKAEKHVQNRYGTLHGGCIATMVDTITTGALVTVCPYPSVSVNLNVSYLSPVKGDSTVEIDARVVKVGKTLATLEADILVDGQICARGSHIKFMNVTSKDPILSTQGTADINAKVAALSKL